MVHAFDRLGRFIRTPRRCASIGEFSVPYAVGRVAAAGAMTLVASVMPDLNSAWFGATLTETMQSNPVTVTSIR